MKESLQEQSLPQNLLGGGVQRWYLARVVSNKAFCGDNNLIFRLATYFKRRQKPWNNSSCGLNGKDIKDTHVE
jgi:hypothetical protein